MLRYRIIRGVLASILIVGAIVLIVHFANTREINRRTAQLVAFEIYSMPDVFME